MTLSAQALAEELQQFDYIKFGLSDDYMETMAESLAAAQIAQKNIYETGWRKKIHEIDFLIDNEQDFGAILRNLITPKQNKSILIPELTQLDFDYDLVEFEETPGMTLCAFDGGYCLVDKGYVDFRLVDMLKECLVPDVDTVVEFGSGWGKNLSLLLMNSGRSDVRYLACEQSESGRNSFKKLFGMIDGLDFGAHPFDFYIPNLDMLERPGHLLAFTSAAVEQIAFLPSSFMENLLDAADKVTLVVYEPIGWQRSIDRSQFAIKTVVDEFGGQVPFEERHAKKYVYKFSDEQFHDNAVSWSIYGKYNLNLLNVINKQLIAGSLQLVSQQYDIYSENPMNPYSLIVLQKT